MKSKPKYVYIVLIIRGEQTQIVGCFYDEDAAHKYTGVDPTIVVQKLAVV